MTAPTGLVIAALQTALRAEHQAVFGYAALGPHLVAAEAVTARLDETAHRAQRDRTEADLTRFGVVPVPSAVSYPVPAASATPAGARRFARTLENDAAAAWRYVIDQAALDAPTAVTTPIRAAAVSALTANAVRALRWAELIYPTRPTVAFPGV